MFSELVDWAERNYSPAIADAMIENSRVPNGGAYTSVGYYPHAEALAMLGALSELTGRQVSELAREYGRFLAGRLAVHHPQLMTGFTDVNSMLQNIETHIHSEVRKLYPEAQTPVVHAETSLTGTRVTYASHRPFADVAHGLIEGFIEWFGETLVVTRSAGADGTSAEFLITPALA
jgi:hypothetical protein